MISLTRIGIGLVLAVGLAGRAEARRVAGPDGDIAPASGALHLVDRDGTVVGTCPLERTEVSAELSGFVARVRVVQRFHNTADRPLEAVYTFPLSERAAVDAMAVRAGEREIRGEIKRRAEARQIYDRARAEGRLAGLLDQERPNVFTQSLANLLPGERVEVRIEYVEPLRYDAGTFEFSFPTVVGPRFVPPPHDGAPRVPDAHRIAPPVTPEGTRAGHDIAIAVDIRAGVPVLGIDSRLHEVDVARDAADRVRVNLRNKAEIPNRDFVLRYAVAGAEVRSAVLAHRTGSGDGYLTVVLVPPARVTPRTAAPKEMVFVIDRSGSQSGLPLLKAKETMLWILDHMNPDDTFQVVDFGSTANVLFERPMRASAEMRRRARAYIQALEANGGTMMAEAVQRVATLPAEGHRLRVVTFMTDGYVGNDLEVIDLVRRLRGTSRWFAFGTGNSVNRFLLEQIARQGGGEVDYVLLSDSGERVARTFYDRIASPVLTDVRLEVEGLEVDRVAPVAVGDVWAERPLVIHARYARPGHGRIVLTGFAGGAPYRQVLDVTLPAREPGNGAIASMWARAAVDELLARDPAGLQTGRFPAALEAEVLGIALPHRLVTPFTSFVAVDETARTAGPVATVHVPVEMPQGVTYEGVLGRSQSAPGAKSLPAAPMPSRHAGGAHEARREAARDVAASEWRSRIPAELRKRLAPELLALLEPTGKPLARPVNLVNGEVEVRVRLRDASPALRTRLEAAGLAVRLVSARDVVGWIAVADLERLAAVKGVELVMPT
jgi:Ca-activated chloride channel family protein